jgi:hypothetical protein
VSSAGPQRSGWRRVGRWVNPTTLVLAGLCFVLPFATVACDTPGGYGHAAPGGTTTYTGVTLIVGGHPTVTPPARIRPVSEWREDRLWPQPAAGVVLLLVIAATVAAVTISDRRVRRASVAAAAAVGATALLVNQALVESALREQVAVQIAGSLPAGKTVRDYVHAGAGFGFCLILLLLIALGNAIAWWRARPRAALVAAGRDVASGATVPTPGPAGT